MKTFNDVISFHGHACPGLALGYRVSLLALSELGRRAEDEELAAMVENDSCAVDAVQVMTGCTFGKGNLVFRDYGKQVYTFFRRGREEGLRISVDWDAPEETPEEKRAWELYSRGDRSPDVERAVHDRKSRKIKAIMDAEDSALFKTTRIAGGPPPEAVIRQSVRCERCREKTMETRLREFKGLRLCIPCFEEESRKGA